MTRDRIKLIHEHDQDHENCRRWWREATNAEKLAVWDVIQRDYSFPEMETMSRFAQLAFTQMALDETEGLSDVDVHPQD